MTWAANHVHLLKIWANHINEIYTYFYIYIVASTYAAESKIDMRRTWGFLKTILKHENIDSDCHVSTFTDTDDIQLDDQPTERILVQGEENPKKRPQDRNPVNFRYSPAMALKFTSFRLL